MSKEWKAPDKVTQKMTRDGAVAENLTTGETSSISERPQEENYSAPAGVAAEKVVQHIGAEIERHAAKGAEKKALDAAQPKTHSSRLQFSEAERATPEDVYKRQAVRPFHPFPEERLAGQRGTDIHCLPHSRDSGNAG